MHSRIPAALVSLSMAAACSSGELDVGTRNAPIGGGMEPDLRPTNRAHSLPIGIEDVNNSPLSATSYRALLRFVPDTTVSIDRFYFGFNVRGASCREPGVGTDGAGDGGVIVATLVAIDAVTGVPSTPIDSERVGACTRYDETVAEVGSTPGLVWANLSGNLEAGKMYGLVVANAAAAPASDYFSFHMPLADAMLAGPQARNELDVNASGAIMSLDPREHIAWSEDGGENWQYGVDNGQYLSYINDDPLGHPAIRVPQYAYRTSNGAVISPQPYYAYNTDCLSCRVLYANARYARSFSELGGFTASGSDVGTLTMTNLTSGAQASCTPELGYGFRTCSLPLPVDVAIGESYSITSTGAVELMHMNAAQRTMFPTVGTSDSPLSASQPNPGGGSNEKDVPSLWAGPVSAGFPDGDDP